MRPRGGRGADPPTLEDGTGITNVLLWARLFAPYRRAVMSTRLMVVESEVQKSREGMST